MKLKVTHVSRVREYFTLLLSTDALSAPPQSKRALQDLSEYERQHPAHPASAAALHPNQHQLQQAGPQLSQQPCPPPTVQR